MDALKFFRHELNNSFTPNATSYQYLIEKFVEGDSTAGARAVMAESLRKGASDLDLLKKQQQMLRRGLVNRYPPSGRNDGGRGLGSVLYDGDIGNGIKCGDAAGNSQPIPIGALASALVNASPTEQRMMLGENLYPLVEQLEGEAAAKLTGMLLEMDHSEILHLLESPEALKAKVAEAMEVLTNVSQPQPGIPANQLTSLSLNDDTVL